MNYEYRLIIDWSVEDAMYLVTIPSFAHIGMQPVTYGYTYEEAARNAQEAIESYILYCEEEGIALPAPLQLA
jgi:antitoxin HicB